MSAMPTATVLVIDDDSLMHKIVRRALEPNGFTVVSAKDGEAGIVSAVKVQPDIILLDVEMPGTNGYEVCERLRTIDETMITPIIFLSGHSSLQQRMQGYEVGADDYMTKPFESEALIAKLRVLNKYQQERRELKDQYQLVQETAKTAITGTGEIGIAMGFLEKAISYNSIDDTVGGLLEATVKLGLDCCVRLEFGTESHWYSSDAAISPLEKELLELSNRNQRFVDFGCRTLVHFSTVTLLIKNMPLDDGMKYGRIKDLVPALMSAVETKCRSLRTHHGLIDQSQDLKQAFGLIRRNLFDLASLIVNNRKRNASLCTRTIHDLSAELMSMGLEEDQEIFILDKIEGSFVESLDQLDVGPEIRSTFTFILENLERTMRKHEALLDAFLVSQTQSDEASTVVDDSIELF